MMDTKQHWVDKMDTRSERNMKGVHPDLVRVVRRAAVESGMDFIVTEGLRTLDRQKLLKAKGASRTLRSRHLTGHAIDVAVKVDGKVRWDWPLYTKLSKHMKAAARAEKVSIEWGGDWKSFRDGPHYQLSWAKYPAK